MKKKAKKAGAKAPGRTLIEVTAHQLRPAPWNPRQEITSESVADLTASVEKIGLIHPIAVMKDPDKPSRKGVDFYLIISGHRRFKACVDAKLSPIPCDLLDVDVMTAKQMTIIENLQRRDADPILESKLVVSLIEGGMTQAEIAAETGRGARWVVRRANLIRLSPSWRKRVEKGERFTTDCLEHIAAYPEKLQEKLKDARPYYGGGKDRPVAWDELRGTFNLESRDLKEAAFRTKMCLACTNNTGCCPDLFDDVAPGKGAQLGKCLDGKCYAKMLEEHVDMTIKNAEDRGRVVVKARPFDCGAYNTTKRPTKENTALYVFTDYNGERCIEYGTPPKKKGGDGDEKPVAEKDVEEKREKRERNKAIRKLAAWCASGADGEPCNLAGLFAEFFNDTPAAPFLVQEAFSGLGCWHLQGCKTPKTECAIAAIFDHLVVPLDIWSRHVAAELIKQLDPSRYEGTRAAHNARILLAMFHEELMDAIGVDACEAICKGRGEPVDIADPKIDWCAAGEDPDEEPDDEIEDAISGEAD